MVTVRVNDDLGEPVAQARTVSGENRGMTDEAGLVRVRWEGVPIAVLIEAEGFFPGALAVASFQDDPVEFNLRPVVLRGAVVDRYGFGLPAASVTLGDTEVVTNRSGRFEISRASAGTIEVSRPGWHDKSMVWDGDLLVQEIEMAPKVIRGLHVAYSVFENESQWPEILALADETVVNALVIDLKDESGRVLYRTGVTLAHDVGAVYDIIDIRSVLADMERRDIYKIARLVTFQDPVAARVEVDMAAFDTATGGPFRKSYQYFLDPTDRQARGYALDLAEEICVAGFDEIQFDYVRFPDGYPDSVRFDLGDSADVRSEAITGFLREATARLHPHGCLVAADIFGFITSVEDDGGIGQNFKSLSSTIDVISPMVYPSHYSRGWFGFDKPNDHPGPVVAGALDAGISRLAGPAVIRPWLQDFYYNASQVRAQIQAAEERDQGWMLWNARSRFQVGALETEPDPGPASLVADHAGAEPES